MDNKPLEGLAEEFIKTRLSKAKIKFLKPNYDIGGSDLVLLNPINKHLAKQVIIQSKGRNITNNPSNVTISSNYIVSNFICFLYLQVDDDDQDYLYIFFSEDIKKWNLTDSKFSLSIPLNFKNSDYFNKNLFDPNVHIPKINDILNDAPILRQSYVNFESMELKQILFEMWKRYDSLPNLSMVIGLYEEFYEQTGTTALDIFTICSIAKHIQNMEYRTLDGFMQDLYMIRNLDKPISESLTIHDNHKIKRMDATRAIVYKHIKFGEVNLTYDGIDYKGLYLYIGDKEDHVEVLLFDNSDYVCFGSRSNY